MTIRFVIIILVFSIQIIIILLHRFKRHSELQILPLPRFSQLHLGHRHRLRYPCFHHSKYYNFYLPLHSSKPSISHFSYHQIHSYHSSFPSFLLHLYLKATYLKHLGPVPHGITQELFCFLCPSFFFGQ